MPTIDVNGQSLFYFEHRATATIPPLLLIHGAGGQHFHWPPQVRRIHGVHTIAPDLPGHGKSEAPGRASINAYAEDMLVLMDALAIERFIPVGHSMGGGIAQQLALSAPERVAGLGLVSTGAKLRVSPQILDHVMNDYDSVVDFVMKYGYGPQADDELIRLGRRALKGSAPEVVQGDYLACDTFDTMGELGVIHVPALIVCGSEDQMTPPKFSQYLADHLPEADYYLLEGAGHMLPVEFPRDLARIMTGWLKQTFSL